MTTGLLDAFEEHRDALLGFIEKRMQNKHMAEDVLHDLFVKVSAHESSSEVMYPKAYLYRMANNLIIDIQRKQTRHAELIDIDPDEQPDESSPELSFQNSQKLSVVTAAIQELPEKTQQVFRMQRLEEMAKAEVAGQLDISVNMVEKHLRRAVQFCRDRLKKLE